MCILMKVSVEAVEESSPGASFYREVLCVHGWGTMTTAQLPTCSPLELQTKVREDFTITEKASTRAYSWLKAPLSTSALSFKTLLRHYATPALTHSK